MTTATPSIARTAATGTAMLDELVRWSTSYADDLAFAREDILASAAHVTMLSRSGLVDVESAMLLRRELLALDEDARTGKLALPEGEEDIHMAVESELAKRLGATSGRLHTARSRNDQVATDLRLYTRGAERTLLEQVSTIVAALADRASKEGHVLLPAYTHRQRAQPISAAFLVASWGASLVRAGDALVHALRSSDELPLGSGACTGSSLPIDRRLSAELLGFSRISDNALDTVGNRDFALDYTYAASRVLLSLGKLSADVVDMSTSEFAMVTLDGSIAAGSSMMPQKKNADVFELVRGKSARGIGNLVALLTLVKGLPSGYNRDQQEDRAALLSTLPLTTGALRAIELALPRIAFDPDAGRRALAEGFTQATDLAEALVRRGVPFREAYKASGALVRLALDRGLALSAVPVADAVAIHPSLDADALLALDPATAVSAKEIPGGTGPRSVATQVETLRERSRTLAAAARAIPSLDEIRARVEAAPLSASR